MRFKSLPTPTQNAFAARWADFVSRQPADLLYPICPADTWLRGFRHLNVRIGAGGMPSADAMERVTNWVEDLLFGPAPEHGTCDCCGETY
jgi:hypothetical protein